MSPAGSKVRASMNDTSDMVRRYVRDRYAALSGAERVMIGARMFETARVIAAAAMPDGLSEQERRRWLCERFYGAELAAKAYPATNSAAPVA